MTHEEWIARYRERHQDLTALCAEATKEMVEAFPELRRVRGHVHMIDPPDGDRRPWPHWWCETEAGDVIDPTTTQFPGGLDYVPLDEELGEPVGRCHNCGGLVYDWGGDTTVCSSECHDAYARAVTERL